MNMLTGNLKRLTNIQSYIDFLIYFELPQDAACIFLIISTSSASLVTLAEGWAYTIVSLTKEKEKEKKVKYLPEKGGKWVLTSRILNPNDKFILVNNRLKHRRACSK